MVDHEERQILQKLEDDALANARQKAQEDAQQSVESPTDEDNPTSGDAVPLADDTGINTFATEGLTSR